MIVKDFAVCGCPLRKPPCEGRTERGVAPYVLEKMPKYPMVYTVIASRQIETGSNSKALFERITAGLIKGYIPLAPFAIEPDTRLACVKVPEDFPVVTMSYTFYQEFGHNIYRRLIDDLVFNC